LVEILHNRRKMIRELPRKRRLLMLISPLVFIGLVDAVRAYRNGDIPELIVVSAIFFVIVFLLQVGWDLLKYR
jgi:hypothetical protein